MIKKIIEENLKKFQNEIDSIKEDKTIDCFTIFSTSDEDYELLNKEAEMKSIEKIVEFVDREYKNIDSKNKNLVL